MATLRRLLTKTRTLLSDSYSLTSSLVASRPTSVQSARSILIDKARRKTAAGGGGGGNAVAIAVLHLDREVGLVRYHGLAGYVRERGLLLPLLPSGLFSGLNAFLFGPPSHVGGGGGGSSSSSTDTDSPTNDAAAASSRDGGPRKNAARVAFMITASQRRELAAPPLCYTAEDIRRLRPLEAMLILEHGVVAGNEDAVRELVEENERARRREEEEEAAEAEAEAERRRLEARRAEEEERLRAREGEEEARKRLMTVQEEHEQEQEDGAARRGREALKAQHSDASLGGEKSPPSPPNGAAVSVAEDGGGDGGSSRHLALAVADPGLPMSGEGHDSSESAAAATKAASLPPTEGGSTYGSGSLASSSGSQSPSPPSNSSSRAPPSTRLEGENATADVYNNESSQRLDVAAAEQVEGTDWYEVVETQESTGKSTVVALYKTLDEAMDCRGWKEGRGRSAYSYEVRRR